MASADLFGPPVTASFSSRTVRPALTAHRARSHRGVSLCIRSCFLLKCALLGFPHGSPTPVLQASLSPPGLPVGNVPAPRTQSLLFPRLWAPCALGFPARTQCLAQVGTRGTLVAKRKTARERKKGLESSNLISESVVSLGLLLHSRSHGFHFS